VSSVSDVRDHVRQERYDLLLMDLNYTRDTTSGREGLELLQQVRKADAALPVVVMTGWGNIDMAVEAMRLGARNFVQKPWDDVTLLELVRREIDDGAALRRRDAQFAREQDEARLIQRALLPSALPDVKGCRLAAQWTPAAGLGGDCYDLLAFGESRLAISIADVIGKGLPAALLMSNLQAAVRAFATATAEPHEVCANVNRLLCRNVSSGKFVTFCYALLNLSTQTVSYANAGHFAPILVHADGRVDRLASTGMVLGIAADSPYASVRMPFAAGARLVCFTDGLSEAAAADGEQFGDQRLLDMVRGHRDLCADELVDVVINAVNDWTGGEAQDDATLIVAAA
jgi:sigma-B regulation protein RsbU (phosphoserine phosphatase)